MSASMQDGAPQQQSRPRWVRNTFADYLAWVQLVTSKWLAQCTYWQNGNVVLLSVHHLMWVTESFVVHLHLRLSLLLLVCSVLELKCLWTKFASGICSPGLSQFAFGPCLGRNVQLRGGGGFHALLLDWAPPHFGVSFLVRTWRAFQVARFYAGAVQLANLGALTRIILSGVLLSKFWCWASSHQELQNGWWRGTHISAGSFLS